MITIFTIIALNVAIAATLARACSKAPVQPHVITVPSFDMARAQWLADHGHTVEIDADRNRVIVTDNRGVCAYRTVHALHGYRVVDGVRFF